MNVVIGKSSGFHFTISGMPQKSLTYEKLVIIVYLQSQQVLYTYDNLSRPILTAGRRSILDWQSDMKLLVTYRDVLNC